MLWKKPSGMEIETQSDEDTRAYCKSLGWKEVKGKSKAKDDSIDKLEPVHEPVSDAEWDKPAKKSKE